MMAYSWAESTLEITNYGRFINQLPPNILRSIRQFERIKKIWRQKISIMFSQICINEEILPIYIYRERGGGRDVCMKVSVCVRRWVEDLSLSVYCGAKTTQRAVPAWIYANLFEGSRPEVGVWKDQERWSVESKTWRWRDLQSKSLAVGERPRSKGSWVLWRDPGKKSLGKSEGRAESVKAMAKQRPWSEQRDESAFLVTFGSFARHLW